MTDHLTFDQLCDIADARANAPDASAREHLAACAECARQLASLTALGVEAARLPREVAPPSEVWTAIRSQLAPRAAASRHRWTRTPARLAAAAVLIAVGSSTLTVLALRQRGHGEPAHETASVKPPASAMQVQRAESELRYTTSVDALRRTLDERRDSLSATTVATVEHSLRIADSAITEAREALVRDPANHLLEQILASNYERKIDLLRRATELAPRT